MNRVTDSFSITYFCTTREPKIVPYHTQLPYCQYPETPLKYPLFQPLHTRNPPPNTEPCRLFRGPTSIEVLRNTHAGATGGSDWRFRHRNRNFCRKSARNPVLTCIIRKLLLYLHTRLRKQVPFRSHSSVGQSDRLIICGSQVQVLLGPRHFSQRFSS